ncbi:MAG: 4-hydroxy-tetrahydrodipicolinate synthase [Bacteroidetes bacterium]|nr:4-hydroxy-tetrahydrodipicolinate synthase [Bacteroidota bacterium]MBT3749695.1 4-hydroxy-tetrahydrodipicolinate synthase [Bacteroidota bacterium]MBT4399320.1 4-hydroxy-tetrahydrodipicolinate synthase [Bacteroidota bacterium]MBT4410800.1 4-hydroxy-tetrahydrodipicolinate synthase [Bacteroidota bacterium]MBT5427253.1 4-hydroxy-tetrahydrodipicolinate synthase [Bacteroidota bacterium]
MDHSFLRGTGVALVTPFNLDKEIDFDALEKVTQHVIAGQADYLVVMGTTGESVVLDTAEKKAVIAKISEVNRGRLPLVLGIGGNNTGAVVKQIHDQDFKNISALLSVSPYYNKPSQEGIFEHFSAIAAASPVPVIIYNVPGRTGSTISPSTTLKLANAYSNIAATKEASGDMEAIMEIISKKPQAFMVISGDDALTLPMLSIGADGVISVIANALPYQMSEIVRQARKNQFDVSKEIHYQILPMIKLIFSEGSPAGIKAALSHINLIDNYIRLPLVPASKALYEKIVSEMKSFM